MEVRDPIHGAIRLAREEMALIDHPFVHRLRNIRQTGFSDLPFPGATHSRYSHSLGVLHLAGKAFDSAFRDWEFSNSAVRRRYRAAVRLAALCHDLGHAPYSHCTEFAMPPLAELGLGDWYAPEVLERRGHKRASHEDYTIAILRHSDLGQRMAADFGVTARHVAALISFDVTLLDDFFLDDDLDHRRGLSQLISSELDVDRLDYLVRDSYYSGARYGQVDVDWLISNLAVHEHEGKVFLALDSQALYSFDDFMIARHHMFLMVYFHHKSVVYEEMLKRYVVDPETDWLLPGDIDTYLHVDDPWLFHHLRQLDHPMARGVVQRRPFKRILERHGTQAEVDLTFEEQQLQAAGLDVIHAGCVGELSRYKAFGQKRKNAPTIYVREGTPGNRVERVVPLSDISRVYRAYAEARTIARLYVAPEQAAEARRILGL